MGPHHLWVGPAVALRRLGRAVPSQVPANLHGDKAKLSLAQRARRGRNVGLLSAIFGRVVGARAAVVLAQGRIDHAKRLDGNECPHLLADVQSPVVHDRRHAVPHSQQVSRWAWALADVHPAEPLLVVDQGQGLKGGQAVVDDHGQGRRGRALREPVRACVEHEVIWDEVFEAKLSCCKRVAVHGADPRRLTARHVHVARRQVRGGGIGVGRVGPVAVGLCAEALRPVEPAWGKALEILAVENVHASHRGCKLKVGHAKVCGDAVG
mmetsp:Transcript_19334/g.61310  ORF Transcript_19334/g.61310 Transcript_19334/m.61310 type:complete len:266 (+) Transcript_19334:1215-2012(+)